VEGVSTAATALPITLIVGDDRAAVERRFRQLLAQASPGAMLVNARPAMEWPFSTPLVDPLPAGPVVVTAPDAHAALETRQPSHTRLVTTQAAYLFVEWAAAVGAHGHARLVATMSRSSILEHAPEVLRRRGVFARMPIEEIEPKSFGKDEEPVANPDVGGRNSQAAALAEAFRENDPETRLAACLRALGLGRTPPALMATASVCQEVNDLDSAARDLDEAIALAPDWAAAHFERGKVWLRRDDMEAAARAFRAAAERLPAFGGAWGNLGATLGELDRPAEALAAFERLRDLDPSSPQAFNNIGVVTRELGRLSESEAAFNRVIELEPGMAFGYYNLGHTLFLQGRYHAAAAAYGRGQGCDPERNPVQATRLALCRLATGDPAGALSELQRASGALPRDYRRQVLSDTSAVLWALITHKPDLAGWQPVHEWVSGELERLA
jgi:tetratricopeptide (TPR) repeat protein